MQLAYALLANYIETFRKLMNIFNGDGRLSFTLGER